MDADPIAACVRGLMTEHTSWTGTAADLLRVSTTRTSSGASLARNPRALAGHLRRAQTFLRAQGIDVTLRGRLRKMSRSHFPAGTMTTRSMRCSYSLSGLPSMRTLSQSLLSPRFLSRAPRWVFHR